ncbi:hypothetical protein M0R45_004400 [Rubus argutus]|uniref:Probable zinc-ribbon domain-containing protein n=1 Tax=Rubus argutus TaxID=59490 RepID=A0AAW1YJS1_RUBAR
MIDDGALLSIPERNVAIADDQSRKMVDLKRRIRPIAGGAPFITCHKCLDVLQIVGFHLSKRRYHKLRCGACSENQRDDFWISADLLQVHEFRIPSQWRKRARRGCRFGSDSDEDENGVSGLICNPTGLGRIEAEARVLGTGELVVELHGRAAAVMMKTLGGSGAEMTMHLLPSPIV